MNKRIAVVITHPIQYYSPLFQLMGADKDIDLKVFYTWSQTKEEVFDPKFGKTVKWDIPLLDGYEYEFVENISPNPNSFKVKGIINPELIGKVEKWKPSSIVVFGWNHESHLKLMKHFKGKVPILFRGDSTLIDEKPGYKTVLRRMWLTYVYRRIDYALYVGENNKDYFLKHGLTENQLLFAPHAIDNDRFYAKSNLQYRKDADKMKDDLGYSDEDIVFLYVGKFESKKNPKLMMEVALKKPQFKFLFVGNGDLEDELKKMAEGCNHIQFLPFQNQSMMPVIYRLGDCFILPSKGPGETWGLACNEAMACGVPVITTDKVGCTPDLVVDGVTGYQFKWNNKQDLSEKLTRIAAKHVEMGKNALNHIKEFDMNALYLAFKKHCK